MTDFHVELPTGLDYMLRSPDPCTGQRSIHCTPKAAEFAAALETMRLTERHLNCSYVGAVIAQCLLDHPWLAKCRVKVWGSAEYDDQGGTYRSANLRVLDLIFRSGVDYPEEVIAESRPDEDLAAELIEEYLQEDDHEFLSVLDGLLGDVISLELEHSIQVDRSRFAEVIDAEGAISGQAAFRCLREIPQPHHPEACYAND